MSGRGELTRTGGGIARLAVAWHTAIRGRHACERGAFRHAGKPEAEDAR